MPDETHSAGEGLDVWPEKVLLGVALPKIVIDSERDTGEEGQEVFCRLAFGYASIYQKWNGSRLLRLTFSH